MANATNSPGPVAGRPYAVLVLTGSFTVERFNYKAPVDALIAAVRYMREGRQVRLTDRTVAALKEVPEMASLDAVIDRVTRPATGPASVPFRAVTGE
ncbi:MAG TPA: hypothetical protein VGI05_26555 [Streptosporangiaceae bacterium]|jgi:hypothetical protein